MKQYDVLVIGTGAANIVLEAALKQGLRCAQIERGKFGGTCLTRGCIPTKVMVTAADFIREVEEAGRIGVEVGKPRLNWEIMSRRVWKKIDESKELLKYYQAEKNLDVYQGTGYFLADKIVQVELVDGSLSEELRADKIFIGVGAHTHIAPMEGLEETGYLTSESLFGDKYPEQPYKSLIIMGGGPIGTEFAHVFSAAGTKVTLVQHNVRLLPKEDEEISAQILKDIRKWGIDVYLNRKPLSMRKEGTEKVLSFADRDTGAVTEVRAEEIMLASGIRPASNSLHLERTGIQTEKNGWIRTNEFLETSVEGVWALGDVNGKAPFRHKANYEAEILAHNLFGDQVPEKWRWARYDVVPAVTYTYPQVAHVGLTEVQAREQGYTIITGRHAYSATAKGYALGFSPQDEHDGFVKLIVEKESYRMLGIHVIGPQASILIQPFINLMNTGLTRLDPVNPDIASDTVARLRSQGLTRLLEPQSVLSVSETMTPHPSLSEVVMWTQYYLDSRPVFDKPLAAE